MSDTTRRAVLDTGIASGVAIIATSGTAAVQTTSSADASAEQPGPPGGARGEFYFFKDPAFEFSFLISLGGAYYQASNVGKVL